MYLIRLNHQIATLNAFIRTLTQVKEIIVSIVSHYHSFVYRLFTFLFSFSFSFSLFFISFSVACVSQGIGRIPLAEATLIEEPNEQFHLVVEDGGECVFTMFTLDRYYNYLCKLVDGQQCQSTQLPGDLPSSSPSTPVHRPSAASFTSSGSLVTASAIASTFASDKDYSQLDFKIIWDCKTSGSRTIHLVAPSMQEKTAWVSDISQVNAYTHTSIKKIFQH